MTASEPQPAAERRHVVVFEDVPPRLLVELRPLLRAEPDHEHRFAGLVAGKKQIGEGS